MSIWKKISTLVQANLNNLLDQVEDKNKLKNQAVLDLNEQKQTAKKLLERAMAQTFLSEQNQDALKQKILHLAAQAEHFIKQNNDTQAKEVLSEKQRAEEEMRAHASDLKKEQDAIAILRRGLDSLDEKITQTKNLASIEASKDALEKDDAFQTFARMEEKIEQKEYALQALNELMAELDRTKADTSSSKPAFDHHSDPQAIEKELLDIKNKIKDK